MQFDDATRMQIRSANPTYSTWVSANAGSGKTRVLTDRVIRLLLHGVNPQHILCLTYTKAAASEMQNRLFTRLGSWAMLETEKLIGELSQLGETDSASPDKIKKARVLFARALEAPGGLKIQTIHSFCSSVLRRFPLEAGVSPQFTEMDDRNAKLLRADVLDEMATGPHVDLIDGMIANFSGLDFDTLIAEVLKNKTKFHTVTKPSDILDYFGLDPDTTAQSILDTVFLGSEKTIIEHLIAVLSQGSTNDQKAAAKLVEINTNAFGFDALEILEGVFLFGAGAKAPFVAKIGKFPTQATIGKLGDSMPEIEQFMMRVEEARPNRIAFLAARKTQALHAFAQVFLALIDKKKQQRGWLDFDDLILLTGQLLQDPAVSQWVLFRLDGGLEHILVDEAQDTSPAQWDVIQSLTQEFFAGLGADQNNHRTVFVVGDKKQSIYSFQGADPTGFERMRESYAQKLEQVESPFQSLDLKYSFRSAAPILSLVDTVFNDLGLKGFDDQIDHLAFQTKIPGRIDLWDVVEKPEEPEKTEWFDPVDKPAPNHEFIVLSQNIAAKIRHMIDTGVMIPDGLDDEGEVKYRAVDEGDFLILVQARSALFHEIITACKNNGLEIAGADRLKIGGELAVKDLVSLLNFLATPEDDLSLAEALKSPLFGWDEQQLFNLAQPRKKHCFLWAALRNSAEHTETIEVLGKLRSDADFLRPYELLERILTRFDGRKKLLSRLGIEADDGIDALLDQALAYESMDVPSLTGFLTWLQSDDVEIKRQYDSKIKQIRVMTVHGAKGLESPIVILPDTMKKRPRNRDEILTTEDDFVFWKTSKAASPESSLLAEEALKEKQEEERLRLLYVAMTRAEKWLIVCGAGDAGSGIDSWYSIIQSAMALSDTEQTPDGLRLQSPNWQDSTKISEPNSAQTPIDLPKWANQTIPKPVENPKPLSPSGLGGAKSLPGEHDEDCDVLAHGTAVHLLLELLPNAPEAEWIARSRRLLSDLQPDEIDAAFAEAQAVLTDHDLGALFRNDALTEVPISATLPELGNQRIHGTIDRLIIEDARVLAIDFKTNAIVPDHPEKIPDGVLRQLGAYAAALTQIYPDKEIQTAVLWTKPRSLMMLTHDQVTAALRHTSLP